MSKRILIVEDSPTEALRARLILEREGYQVSLASTGKEGLVRAAQEQPDLVILDSVMPRMSGYEVYQRLKVDRRTADIPVLMLLAEVEPTDTPQRLSRSADIYIAKPYAPSLLLAGVEQVTGVDGEAEVEGQVREREVGSRGDGRGDGRGQQVPAVPTTLEGQTAAHPTVAAVPEQVRLEQEIARYRQEIEQARQEAEAARRAKSEFLATMSHELRTPLHEIMGMIDLVMDTDLTPDQQNYLHTARNSANTLLAIISDILEFAELEAGKLRLEETSFNLWTTVEEVMEMMGPQAREKGLKLSCLISPEVPRELVGDARRLRRVLLNLVDNGVRFTEEGEVTLKVEVKASQEEEIELHFLVRDTGIGIPAEKQAIIFETFRQADGSTTRRYGSIGLGLAMAKQLVERMGGRIWVESEVGKGSTFHFIVRLKRPQEVGPPTRRDVGEERPTLHILLAEDSPTNQLIAVANLKKAGHTVHVVDNGRKAVQAVEEGTYDLVLMDVAMPEMDGLEATRLIRAREKETGRHIPIIAMTAFALNEYREKCLEAGMDSYVTKPVRPDELHRVIAPFLSPAGEDQTATATEAIPPVDLDEALEVVGGDEDLLKDVVTMSLEECPQQVEKLKAAVAQQDASGVESAAHRLKGILSNLGSGPARDLAQRLETMGEEASLDGAAAVLEQLTAEIERVVAFYANLGLL